MELPGATPDHIIQALLSQPPERGVCILDSCGRGRPGENRFIAAIDPVSVVEIADPDTALTALEQALNDPSLTAVFTLSYDIGVEMMGIRSRHRPDSPGLYLALFDSLLVHDYDTGRTEVAGSGLQNWTKLFSDTPELPERSLNAPEARSNFSRDEYISAVEAVKELIREGETYQTNLTQQIRLPARRSDAAGVFASLRREHPAQFSAFIARSDSTVVSASPERLFKVVGGEISASPIKGTIRRTGDPLVDRELRDRLANSRKDRAENTMIVDLVRNDLGRVCEFGSVDVEALCEIEEHPTLYHLVSTVRGRLRDDADYADIFRSLFPCGSITGAPKRRTMEIIDRLEPSPRGLSMGAIGFRVPGSGLGTAILDTSVAIRTIEFARGEAVFNVGGGVTIDSDAAAEYDESLLKAKALLRALSDAQLVE